MLEKIKESYQSIDGLVSRLGDRLPIRLRVETVPRRDMEARCEQVRTCFAAYEPSIVVGEYLGTGGFADVFTATSEYEGVRHFALKVLRSDLLELRRDRDRNREEMRVKEVKKRFTNEAFVQWHLSKSVAEEVTRSVVKVYDHGEFDSTLRFRFILMERMASTLRDFVNDKENTIADPELLKYKALLMLRVAQIICAVHKQGIFHRDVKPENILFPRQQLPYFVSTLHTLEEALRQIEVKLGDFGTVRWVRSYGDQYDGVIVGSQYYMSPEQIYDPEHLDLRTDIYSFGIVCYELLYGHHPKAVRAETDNFLEKLAKQEPAPRTPPREYEGLHEIILGCMRSRYRRFQTMDEVVSRLAGFARTLFR